MARLIYLSAQRPRAPFRKRPPIKRGRRRRFGFGAWLLLAVGGGFAGTLAALQFAPVGEVAALTGRSPFSAVSASRDTLSARFGYCHRGGGSNCVVDGDTFWFDGEKYRISDIDTPETHPARCAEEQALGDAATARLQDWLNAGRFSLEQDGRDTDPFGRKLRIVTRDGASVGDMLVDAGLARRLEGARRPWC